MLNLNELKSKLSEIDSHVDYTYGYENVDSETPLSYFNSHFDFNSAYVKSYSIPLMTTDGVRDSFCIKNEDITIIPQGPILKSIYGNLVFLKTRLNVVNNFLLKDSNIDQVTFNFISSIYKKSRILVNALDIFDKEILSRQIRLLKHLLKASMRNTMLIINFEEIIESYNVSEDESWYDMVINDEEEIHNHECDSDDHDKVFEIMKENISESVIKSLGIVRFNNDNSPNLMEIFFDELEKSMKIPNDYDNFNKKNIVIVNAEYQSCECEIFCNHLNIFLKKPEEKSKNISENKIDILEQKKFYYITQYSNLMTKEEILEMFEMSFEDCLKKIKTLRGYEEQGSLINERLLVNPSYFLNKKKEINTETSYMFDTNIFISHMINPLDINIVFSKVVMFEIIKLKKHLNAYKRFFRFMFSSPRVSFPETPFSKLRPTFYDDELIKEIPDNCILVTEDVELRSRIPNKSVSYGTFVSKIRPKKSFQNLTLSPRACKFFLNTFNWSKENPKIVNNVFFFYPVIPEKTKNDIIALNYKSETLIDIPEEIENIKIDLEIPEIHSKPIVSISNISSFDPKFIYDVSYVFPYKFTKSTKLSIHDYEITLKEYDELLNSDEIFPIELSSDCILENFARSANLRKLERIKKRSTDLFYNNMNLKYRFEKESKNDKIKCVKNCDELNDFLGKISYHVQNNDYILIKKPVIEGPYDIMLDEVKMSPLLRTLRLISKLYEDMIYQFSVKMKSNEIIVRDNGLPFGYILYPGRTEKRFNTIRSYRLIFKSSSEGLWHPEASFGDYSVSRCYTESIEDIKFKSDLFDNLLPIYIRGLMTDVEFLQFFYHVFWSNTSSKKQLGFLKYYTVISESTYSNIENLSKKYLMNPYKKQVHLSYQFKIYEMINKNLTSSFNSIFSKSKDIFDFIDSNSVFVYNKKTGQNRFHSFKQFITDIDNNCNEFEEKFSGIKYDNDGNMKGKFVYLPALKESFSLFRKKLQRRNVKKDDILDSFKRNIVDDFGVFKSSNGSLDMNDEFKKKKCIETYLSELESQGEFSDELKFISNCLNKDVDERLTGLSKKPQAEGTNREIYITNIKKRCQLFIIQSFFKVLCKYSDIDMVVESQFDKFQLIQDSSSSDGKKTFLNADMGKWSPQDVQEKFDYTLELLIEQDLVPEEIIGLLRKCMRDAKEFLIIIPKDITETDFYKSFKEDCNRSFQTFEFKTNNYETMSFDYGWPQGMFHNISSFIHSCSCDLTDKIIRSEIPSVLSNKFFVSSDDKNLVTTFNKDPTLEDMKKIMEITDRVSLGFSLESSKTKNSISTTLTEMISVINYQGTIVYSPMKSLANMKSSFDDECFIKNHKNILSRMCSFFGMSNRLEMSEKLYKYYFDLLCEHYKLEPDISAPISCFGMKSCSIMEYHRDSESYDNLAKYVKNPQLTYDYLYNRKQMKVLDTYKSERINKLLNGKRGLIEHYKHEMNKSQFDIDINFVIGMEYSSIEKGKKRMFLNKSDSSFNSYYYKSKKPIYKIGNDKLISTKAMSRLSRPCGIPHELSNLIYRTRTVASSFLETRNLIAHFQKQYKPEGKLHFLKNKSYENINNNFNELLMFVKNPIGTQRNPFYSRKVDSMIRDVRNICKSLRITTVEEFEASEEQFNELKDRVKSNLYYRLQHNGEKETLDYSFETRKVDIIDSNFIVENTEFRSEISRNSQTFKSNFKQIMNTLCFDIKVLKVNDQEAVNKALYSYEEMSKGFRLENIESYVSSMSDVFQLFNLKVHPGTHTKFTGKGKERLEWESISERMSIVRVKRGLQDLAIGIADELNQLIIFKEEHKIAQKIMRIDNLEFVIDSELFDKMSHGYENIMKLNDSSPDVQAIEARIDKKVYLEFSGNKFRSRKLVPLSKVSKNDVTVQYRSLDDYLVTVKKLGNICYIKGNNIKDVSEPTLDLNMKSKVSLDDLNNYKTILEDEFGCDVYVCKHVKECLFNIKNHKKYVTMCSSSFKWCYYVDSVKLDEMHFTKNDIIKNVIKEKNDFETSEYLEELYCSNKLFKNGQDLFNVFNKRLTKRDSVIISKALRKNLITEREILNCYVLDTKELSLTYNDGFDNVILKPKEEFVMNYYKLKEEFKIPENIDEKYFKKTKNMKENDKERYEQIRTKCYEYFEKRKAMNNEEKHEKNKYIDIYDDIKEIIEYRSYADQFFDNDEEEYTDALIEYLSIKENDHDFLSIENKVKNNEELYEIFKFETDLFAKKTDHSDEDCDDETCYCKKESLDEFLKENKFEYKTDDEKYEILDEFCKKGFSYSNHVDECYYWEDICNLKKNIKKEEEIHLSCQCNDTFNCYHKEVEESKNVAVYLLEEKNKNFKEFIDFCEEKKEEYYKSREMFIYYNDDFVFLPNIEANFRDPKILNKELFIENQHDFEISKMNLSEIFKDIDIQFKETMDEDEVEQKILDKKNEELKELTEENVTNYEFLFYKEVQKPKISNLNDISRNEMDSRSERILRMCPEKINESIKVFGFDPKIVYERKKNFSKFNNISETTLSGYRTTNSEIFDESKKFDTIELDCSKETALKAYVAYVYIYKKLLNSPKILRQSLNGIKNSLNLYLIVNKENVEINNFEAFSYVFNNLETEINKTSGFLKSLMGESLVNLDSVRDIFRKINRHDLIDLLI
jgi:hypothetical protein